MEENNEYTEPLVTIGVPMAEPEDLGDGTEKEGSDDSLKQLMEKPFDPTLIKVESKTPSLDTLIKRIKGNTIQMDTSNYFQRQDDLWDKGKQSRLIESILIRFPLPAFFFDASDDHNWLVVDGLQRLSSIRNFCVTKTLLLQDLEFLTHLNGKGWDDLNGDLHRVIEEAEVIIYKILPGTPTDVKFNIFKRINTGGLILEAQEIRHALFQGAPSHFVTELARTKEFLDATEHKIATRRMLDRDFVNRFLCFYLFGTENYGTKEYGQDLDTFMSKAMTKIYDLSAVDLDKIREDFKQSMILAKEIFGREAFRKVYYSHSKLPPINKALFDAIAVQFALINNTDREKLKTQKEKFKRSLAEKLNKDQYFFTSVTTSTSDRNRVVKRHTVISELIKAITYPV
ncbi:MAG TPA: DUF262 domain-containing protein [Chitinophagaceae bacterium]|nr:DUF262 domain-containing protein [Chitinophagaceae bacterium]